MAENNGEEALRLMREAADMEDKSEKHPVTPGRLLRPADALREYEASHKREPERFRGLYGAALLHAPRAGSRQG